MGSDNNDSVVDSGAEDVTKPSLFERVVSWENLLGAYHDARKGKRTRLSVMLFEAERERNLLRLQQEMRDGTFQCGRYREFTVYEPKERAIKALPFRDRVMQHAIYRVITPLFDREFVDNSFACRVGKGTKKAVDLAASLIRKESCAWYLYCDVSKFFSSIRHSILKDLISRRITEAPLLLLIAKVIDSTPGDRGVPIGNLLSQLFANIYLHELDFFVYHSIRPVKYVRYMDDFVLFFRTKDSAKVAKANIESFLSVSLDLQLNDRSRVGRLRDGITFCGVIMNERVLKRRSRNLRMIQRKVRAWMGGKMADRDLLAVLGSSIGLVKDTKSACVLNKAYVDLIGHILNGRGGGSY